MSGIFFSEDSIKSSKDNLSWEALGLGVHDWRNVGIHKRPSDVKIDDVWDSQVIYVGKPCDGNSTIVAVAKTGSSQEKIVLKVFPRKRNSSEKDVEQEYHESSVYKVLAEFPHPNIVNLLGTWDGLANHFCLAFEYGSGGDLVSYIPQYKGLPWRKAAGLACQLMAAIAHLHSLGYVHRDVKCENCVLSECHKQLKLIDFESCCRVVDHKAASCYGGTRPYLAPERLNSIRVKFDPRSADVFSAGVVLYCMLCGRFPWEEAHSSDVRYNIFSTTLVLSLPASDCDGNDIPPDLTEVMQEMMDPDPDFRCTASKAHTLLKELID